MWGIIIALVSGALMSIQGVFNTEVTNLGIFWMGAAYRISYLSTDVDMHRKGAD